MAAYIEHVLAIGSSLQAIKVGQVHSEDWVAPDVIQHRLGSELVEVGHVNDADLAVPQYLYSKRFQGQASTVSNCRALKVYRVHTISCP